MNRADPSSSTYTTFDAVVVGAGFAGLYMLYRLRQLGLRVRAYEAGDGVGGTWYWNRYPGARCDVESMQYSYSFSEDLQREWHWTERYPQQEEILRYINHVADRFDLRRDIQLETRVIKAVHDEKNSQWTVLTDRGDKVVTRFLISAAGCLSAGRVPDITGLDSFKGKWFHTGNWPHEKVDFTGRRVGVIGTGSSGIQAIPVIAREAAQVVVFQRTPNFSIPAWNRPLTEEEQLAWKAKYPEHREKARRTRSGILYEYSQRATNDVNEEERQQEYERRWKRGGANFTHAFNDIFINRESNDKAAEFVRNKIRCTVKDPKVAELLSPNDHAIGTKRICVDTDYYETFNLEHVSLVDLRATPIQEIVPAGIRTDAATYELDAIVFATGYDAVTGSLDRIEIRGRGGKALKDKWSEGPRTYLGLMTAGFPNLFFITGPGSPSVLTNVVVAIEQHVDWISRCLQHMQAEDLDVAEPMAAAENEWVAHVNEVADKTLFPSTKSWYMGANVPGKPRVFLPYVGGFGNYTSICEEVVAEGYRGVRFGSANAAKDRAAVDEAFSMPHR
ncbi:NAD(P)/FAD-dependent oxidoreductase [Ramlibacter sp. 2FC]|uniref:flavin-containing monooxygenase n=1 Tax=Ramlibacter sp. 2FC TaxID=2502188 RepID=UPI0010F61D94|nr:NAD(P)/FAD-dependent oxidoreductase [Ramlibacter sp. 2FC]